MNMIRSWWEALRLLPCAVTVFLAYGKMGYYPWHHVTSAIGSYYKEKKKLKAAVLVEYLWGWFPIGTLMCSIDAGWLPVDVMFSHEMQNIRRDGGRLGYFGKFAVIPRLHGKRTGKHLIDSAIRWGRTECLSHVVVIVHPSHVKYYKQMGFTVVSRSHDTTPGLEKAPAVLLVLDVSRFNAERRHHIDTALCLNHDKFHPSHRRTLDGTS